MVDRRLDWVDIEGKTKLICRANRSEGLELEFHDTVDCNQLQAKLYWRY